MALKAALGQRDRCLVVVWAVLGRVCRCWAVAPGLVHREREDLRLRWIPLLFFFFQAEDGIRDSSVTGVQTCALPISYRRERTLTFLIFPFSNAGRRMAGASSHFRWCLRGIRRPANETWGCTACRFTTSGRRECTGRRRNTERSIFGERERSSPTGEFPG